MKIPYDSLTLRSVVEELQRALLGGQVQKVSQPNPLEIALTVRNRGANHRLALSCHPVFARAHLTAARPPNPPEAPAFCMVCRKHLEGGHVTSVSQRGFDRILDITVRHLDGPAVSLIVELMGKHSNLILVNESGIVLDSAKRITRRMSRYREVRPGAPYLLPPAQRGAEDPFACSRAALDELERAMPPDPEAQAARLMARFEGFSPFLADEIALRFRLSGSLVQTWNAIFGAASRGEYAPVVIRDEERRIAGAYPFPSVQVPEALQNARDSISIALDQYYSTALARAERDELAGETAAALTRSLRALEAQRVSILRSLEEASRAEEHRRIAELILANAHAIGEKAESVTVPDLFTEGAPERVIPLDPAKSPAENAETWFCRYRKARDGAASHARRMVEVESKLREIEAALRAAREESDAEKLRALRADLASRGVLRRDVVTPESESDRPDFQGRKIRIYHAPEGFEILVGENSEANDYLTGRIAAPGDIWLHVRGGTSAHVVIRTHNNAASVPPSVLQRAAWLAARHSPSKHSSTVAVDWTLKKHVRRPRRAPSGTAVYQHERTLHVSPREEL